MRQLLLSLSLMVFFAGCGAAFADTPATIGTVQTYTAKSEDTFAALAERYNTGYVALIAANPGIDPWLPGEGTKITIPSQYIVPPGLTGNAPHEGIVVNLGELRLYYYAQANGTPESFAIGVGREGKETPHGQTTIVRKAANPVWYPTANTRADKPELPAAVPAGDDNPLGLYALYLGWPSYLIHGTNNPQGVGRQASRGCMRLYPDSIKELFERVPVGTKVTVIDQPVEFVRIEGKLYMSIFPSTAQIDELEDHNSMTPEAPAGLAQMVLAAAGPDADRLDWNAIRKASDERRGYPVPITTDQLQPQPPMVMSETLPQATPEAALETATVMPQTPTETPTETQVEVPVVAEPATTIQPEPLPQTAPNETMPADTVALAEPAVETDNHAVDDKTTDLNRLGQSDDTGNLNRQEIQKLDDGAIEIKNTESKNQEPDLQPASP